MMHQDRRPSRLWPFRRQRRETAEGNPFPADAVQGLGLVGGDMLGLDQRNSSEIHFDEENPFRYSNSTTTTTTLADAPGVSSSSPGSSPDVRFDRRDSLVSPGSSPIFRRNNRPGILPSPGSSPYLRDGTSSTGSSPDLRRGIFSPGSSPNLQNERRPSWVRRKGSSAVSALVFCAGVGSVPPTQRYLQASVAKGQT